MKGKLYVSNNKQEAVTVNCTLKDAWTEATGIPSPGHSEWLSLSMRKNMTLKPGSVKPVKYKIKVPRDAAGEMMAMMSFNIATHSDPAGNPVPFRVEMKHGIPLYVIVKGTEKAEAQTGNLNAHFVREVSTGPIEFFVKLKNTGNVHVRPSGKFAIYSEGIEKDSFELEHGWPIYPGESHNYFAKTNVTGWKAGNYEVRFRVAAGSPSSLFAKWTLAEKAVPFAVTTQGKVVVQNP